MSMKIYCSGIGGIGLSAYASLLQHYGHTVYGSDRQESELTKRLESMGITVLYDQSASNMPPDLDALVYSEAIPPDAPERVYATKHNIPQKSYFKALGELSADHFVVAVCGTHGKSSTTSMAAQVLTQNGIDPSVVVGTKVPFLSNQNWRAGLSNVFLVEACEYRRSFHYLQPNVVLLLNADGDHYDAYDGQEEYQQAFADFLALLPDDGIIITHGNDLTCAKLAKQSGKTVINADQYDLPALNVPGKHMQQNAQLVLALEQVFDGLTLDGIQESLRMYAGCWRRLERIGSFKDAIVYDDYGHHPHEVQANIAALNEAHPDQKLTLVFQPHMQSRTTEFYDQFTNCFKGVDTLILVDVYEARNDTNEAVVDMKQFTNDIEQGSDCQVVPSGTLQNTEDYVKTLPLSGNDVLVFMGAGPITNVARSIAH